jgi:hypothetical protein
MLQLVLAKISFLGVVHTLNSTTAEVCRPVCPCVSSVQTLKYEYPCSYQPVRFSCASANTCRPASRKLHSRNINYHTKEMVKEIYIGDWFIPPLVGQAVWSVLMYPRRHSLQHCGNVPM